MDKDYFADAYSPPGSDVNAGALPGRAQGAALAGRGTRLAAASLDVLLISVPLLPLLAAGIHAGVRTIFREDRRCLHDHIAGTRVVEHQR